MKRAVTITVISTFVISVSVMAVLFYFNQADVIPDPNPRPQVPFHSHDPWIYFFP